MASWRDSILKNFKRGIARLTLVSDPDGLLTEERMAKAIHDRGFEIIPFDDAIAFRFAYESKYRSVWDQGQDTDLVVVLRSEQELGTLPYDLLKAGRQLSFALHKLFPKLAYPVIETLDRSRLDALYQAYEEHDGSAMGDRSTKEFVLMHCFGVVPKLIKTPVDLLKFLVSRHYRGLVIPRSLDDLLLETLRSEPGLKGWPLNEVVPDRQAFLGFLQEHWPNYVESVSTPGQTCMVPFGHEDVRVYIDNMFLEGLLTPIQPNDVSHLPKWVMTGIVHDRQGDALNRLRRLLARFIEQMPSADAPHREWLRAATTWGELVVLRWELDEVMSDQDRTTWTQTHATVEQRFGQWMLERFASLPSLPFLPQPVMVHHIPRYLAALRSKGNLTKIALLVIDGLAMDQWLILRKYLSSQRPAWKIEEEPVFAWVPTLTSVSRQSIFAGEPPLYYPDSFERTDREKNLWCRFWEDQTGTRGIADLVKPVDSPQSPDLESSLANPRLGVLGIVVNTVDHILHGMQLGTAGMLSQVKLWGSQGGLVAIVERLLAEEFHVFITSDHGNISAEGIGSPKEGVLVEFKGKRARVYDNAGFRDEVKAQYPQSIVWPGPGLPPNRYVLLAPDLQAFTMAGERVVSHGGISLEEVIVPFVRISKDAT